MPIEVIEKTVHSIRPLGAYCVGIKVEAPEQKYGRIVLPANAQKYEFARITAVGLGDFQDGSRIPLDVKVGEVVMYYDCNRHVTMNGKTHVLIAPNDLIAVLDEVKK